MAKIPFSIGSRQAALGPVSELGEFFGTEPFPFRELASGLPRAGAGQQQRKVKPEDRPEGLKAVGLFGEVVELPDDDFIKQSRENTEAKRQELATFVLKEGSKNALIPKMIADFQSGVQAAKENENRAIRNKAQIDAFQKRISGKDQNEHDFLEVERAIRDYTLARDADPFGTIPDLNLDPLIARLPKKTERNKIINESLGKVRAKAAFSQDDLENVRNATIQDVNGERVLVSVNGQRIPESDVSIALEEVFQQPGFMEDVIRQAESESESETVISSGDTETVNARIDEILEGHRRRALATFPGGALTQSIKTVKKGKGLEFRFGDGAASNKRWSFVYGKTGVVTKSEFPDMSAENLAKLNNHLVKTGISGDRIRIQGISDATENKPITLQVDREGNKALAFPIQWERESGGEWNLLVAQEVDAFDEGGKKTGKELVTKLVPNHLVAADIQAQTGMTAERFMEENGLDGAPVEEVVQTEPKPGQQTITIDEIRNSNPNTKMSDEKLKILFERKGFIIQ